MAGGEANFGVGMEHTQCGEPVLHQTVEAGPVGPAFPAAAEKYSPTQRLKTISARGSAAAVQNASGEAPKRCAQIFG